MQLIVTSPPYWRLRVYDIPDIQIGNWVGQYGHEERAFGGEHSYLEHTLLWCKEAWRVLKKDGVFFLNIGDVYNSDSGGYSDGSLGSINTRLPFKKSHSDIPKRTKMLIPERIAIELMNNGWCLINNIIWHIPNKLPEPVKRRFAKRYENILVLTKHKDYNFYIDPVREKHAESTIKRVKYRVGNCKKSLPGHPSGDMGHIIGIGKNPGDVWVIPQTNMSEEHYAVFPKEIARRAILCSTLPGDIVLDPFAGSGTTLKAADELNRNGIGIDLGYSSVQKKVLTNIQKELMY